MMRSQSRRKTLRVALTGSGWSRPRLLPGADAYGARASAASTAMPDRQLTKAPRALNYRSGPLAIIGMRMDDITVTERAARRIGELLRREPPGTMLRGSVEGGACSGFQYKFHTDRAHSSR